MSTIVSRRFFVQHLSATVVPGSERKVNDWLLRSGFELGGTSQSLFGGARLRSEFKALVLDVDGSIGKLTIKVDGTREIDIAQGAVSVGEKGADDFFRCKWLGTDLQFKLFVFDVRRSLLGQSFLVGEAHLHSVKIRVTFLVGVELLHPRLVPVGERRKSPAGDSKLQNLEMVNQSLPS